jgi:hypothetical protein
MQQPSLFDSTATGFPSRDGSNTRSQETKKLLPSTNPIIGLNAFSDLVEFVDASCHNTKNAEFHSFCKSDGIVLWVGSL